jgi:hypothetical protein
VSDFRLPAPEIPDAEVDGSPDAPPLLDSAWDFAEQCQRLIDSKAYRLWDGNAA